MQTGQLVNTCIWALVIDINWICCPNAHRISNNWQNIELGASAYIPPAWQDSFNALLITCPGLERAT